MATVYHYFRTWRVDGTWESINRDVHPKMEEFPLYFRALLRGNGTRQVELARV
jgi:hypothetical protein